MDGGSTTPLHSRRRMLSAPKEFILTWRKTEPATDRLAKWALKVEWSGLRTCPVTLQRLGVGIGATTRVHRDGGRPVLFFNCTRLASSPPHVARGSIMVSLLSVAEATRAPTTGRSRTRREHHVVSMVTSGSSAVHVFARECGILSGPPSFAVVSGVVSCRVCV